MSLSLCSNEWKKLNNQTYFAYVEGKLSLTSSPAWKKVPSYANYCNNIVLLPYEIVKTAHFSYWCINPFKLSSSCLRLAVTIKDAFLGK